MFRLLGNPKVLCDGISRRDLLHVGGLGAFGLALDHWLLCQQAAAAPRAASRQIGPKFGRAKSCILIYKYGSPPQHETFDPKPEAPAEIQGELKAIPTSVPGIHIGERLPKFARIMDLEQRGLLDETLVPVISEHGRTPQLDSKPQGAGRHHWSRAYSQVYAGGGMGRGNLVGRTGKHAEDVEETPISPKDILATAFHLLGVDPESTFPEPEGRPLPPAGTGHFRPELVNG